jgi:hypothetical protein
VKRIEQNKGVAKQGCNEAREQQRKEQWSKGMQIFGKTNGRVARIYILANVQVGHIYIQECGAKASCYHWTMMPPKPNTYLKPKPL